LSGYFNKHGDYIQGPVLEIDESFYSAAWDHAVERSRQNGSLARRTETGNNDYFQRQLVGALAERTVLETFAGAELNPDPAGYWDIKYRGVRLEVKGKHPNFRYLYAYENDRHKVAEYWVSVVVDLEQSFTALAGYISEGELFAPESEFSWDDQNNNKRRTGHRVPYSSLHPYGRGPLFL
jgi:hypothetical protein